MTRLHIPGAWYVDARPSGAFVALIKDSHLVTDAGRVELPHGQNLLYVRIAPDGIRFAGAGHQDDLVWEWDGTAWVSHGSAFGVSPVIYDRSGQLLINDSSWGSQGARYIGPRGDVITGDATYYSSSLDLSEFSYIAPDLYIGQSHPDGSNDAAWVRDRGTPRLLEPGPCRFIREAHDGERVSIAMWKPHEGAVIYWLSLDEIRALPVVPIMSTPVPNPGTPPAPPQPQPEPSPMEAKRLPNDVHAIVVALHAANLRLANSSNDDDRRALQRKICETVRARKGPRWGWKSNHGIGQSNAKDAIAQIPDGDTFTPNQRQPLYIWDLFNGGNRQPNAQPVMSETEHVEQFFVPVEPVDHLGTPVPQPEPEPEPLPVPEPVPVPVPMPVPPSSNLEARVAAIERWIRRPL